MTLGRRVSQERDVWQHVWKHVDTFLDRIDAAADQDKPHATTMCALFPVFGVIEGARQRSVGYRLDAALAATAGGTRSDGTLIGTVGAGDLKSSSRVPGVEDCEFAVAGYHVNKDGELDDPPRSFMTRSINLAEFRDQKHGHVVLRTPTYDFGQLGGAPMIEVDIGDGGLFPKQSREDAIQGGEAKFVAWGELRRQRLAAAKTKQGSAAVALSTRLAALAYPPKPEELTAIANSARSYAQLARADVTTLNQAKTTLSDAGIGDEVTGAIASASATLQDQATAFDAAAAQMSTTSNPSYSTLTAWVQLLAKAEGTIAPSGLPTVIDKLDGAAAKAMNEAVENRIGYPDGPLRQLRMLEWTLRFFWEHRTAWMQWRWQLVLRPLHHEYASGFTRSLERVLAGQHSGIPLPGNTLLGKQVTHGAREIPLSNLPDLSTLVAGQIVIVGGDRPTAAPVIDVLVDGKKLPPIRLAVPALAVSVATDRGLPGTPGLVPVATPLRTSYRKLDDAELLRGEHRDGRAGDAYVHALAAHRSRLALVLGDRGGDDRPAPPPLARPYATIDRFPLEGTITPSMNRLFLAKLPAISASGTGEQLVLAVPGEMLLLYGRDQDGAAWQTAIEVDSIRIVTGAEAKADETAGATPVPACCAHDQPVMIVYLRSMYFPPDVTELRGAFLHRSFAGFGARSLMARTVLPVAVDPQTASTVQVGPDVLEPRRDPELEVAWRVFDDWLPKETA